MSDKWDAYIVEDATSEDKWSAYEVKETAPEKSMPQLSTLERMSRPSAFGPLGQAYQAIPPQIQEKLSEAGLFGPIGTKAGQAVMSAPYKISKAATEFAQNQLKKIPQIKEFYQKPEALGLYGPLGTGAGYLMKPEQREKLATGTISELGGALGGMKIYDQISKFLLNPPKLINLGGRKTAQAIAEKADKGFDKLSKTLSDKYDDVFSNIEAKVKTADIVDDIQNTINEFPEGANIGKLKSIAKRLGETKEISAKELFNIKKEISKTIPKSVWNGVSDADAITNSKEGLYWKLTKKLEEVGGEKFAGLTEEYKQFKQAERLARKMFYRQGIPSNVPLGGTYDIPTEKAVRGLSSQLPPKEQFAQLFEAWRRGQTVKKTAGLLGGGSALTYLAHRYLSNKLLRGGD